MVNRFAKLESLLWETTIEIVQRFEETGVFQKWQKKKYLEKCDEDD